MTIDDSSVTCCLVLKIAAINSKIIVEGFIAV